MMSQDQNGSAGTAIGSAITVNPILLFAYLLLRPE